MGKKKPFNLEKYLIGISPTNCNIRINDLHKRKIEIFDMMTNAADDDDDDALHRGEREYNDIKAVIDVLKRYRSTYYGIKHEEEY